MIYNFQYTNLVNFFLRERAPRNNNDVNLWLIQGKIKPLDIDSEFREEFNNYIFGDNPL